MWFHSSFSMVWLMMILLENSHGNKIKKLRWFWFTRNTWSYDDLRRRFDFVNLEKYIYLMISTCDKKKKKARVAMKWNFFRFSSSRRPRNEKNKIFFSSQTFIFLSIISLWLCRLVSNFMSFWNSSKTLKMREFLSPPKNRKILIDDSMT